MSDERPWISDTSETADVEDLLVGNRAGLEALRAAIDRALSEGEAPIKEVGIGYMGVRVMATDPRQPPPGPRACHALWSR